MNALFLNNLRIKLLTWCRSLSSARTFSNLTIKGHHNQKTNITTILILRPRANFASFPNNVLYCKKFRITAVFSCLISNLELYHILSLTFNDFDSFEDYSYFVECLCLGLSGVPLGFDSGYTSLSGIPQKCCTYSFSLHDVSFPHDWWCALWSLDWGGVCRTSLCSYRFSLGVNAFVWRHIRTL